MQLRYNSRMTKLLQEVITLLRIRQGAEQDRAAELVFAFTRELNDRAQELSAS